MRPDEAHKRVAALTDLLRSFGLVDRFGLVRLVRDSTVLARPEVLERLRANADALPPAVGAEYLADAIIAEIGQHESYSDALNRQEPLSLEDLERLEAIPAGNKTSNAYQQQVRRLIGEIFAGKLVDEGAEVGQHRGIGRIDLLYRNAAKSGFFEEAPRLLQLKGMYVPVECKNYTDDPENPEFAQLLQRLNPQFASLGILACRQVKNRELALRRCAASVRDNKWLLIITDADFRRMLKAKVANNWAAVELPLYEQQKALALD